ncbi:T6SS effector phospholipase Tle3 domain-containing protein [Massilia sp. BKSP1R2A-1]|uniref:T6SS effector phospholipase Tle3 domain-containing protein n=1 Tax=Massilia sp. BKSP1R2A-1 TaxID=3422595 RepID=UPI003D3564AC
MPYPREASCIGKDASVLQCGRKSDKTVDVRPDLPCNVIVIHGVNDVGTGFGAVEEGLCAGLDVRLQGAPGRFVPGSYRMPTAADKNVVEPDPDAVFFKRSIAEATHSPVIPFYWGYRELRSEAGTKNGQRIDRFGNRLDKDLSKGGGPFANATSTLPDMWNRGICAPADVGGDPIRPVYSAPGRMYMVLAAKRLAALVAMIRDYDANEVVNIVAHSQGCLVSLLAQAFLLDEGKRPADTLVLTHPPYSLEEDAGVLVGIAETVKSGSDRAMEGHYAPLRSRQTFDARLRTLANIVQGVAARKHTAPAFTALSDHAKHHGMVGAKWSAGADRDNRGKVYLYFCPEDMTVALDNMKGIGWQGVPDFMSGQAVPKDGSTRVRGGWGNSTRRVATERQERKPLAELGRGFFQRVFTAKQRNGRAVLVGQPPHDFALRIEGEDDHAHVADANRTLRTHHPEAAQPAKTGMLDFMKSATDKREGMRTINGEALGTPVPADLRGSGQIDPKNIPKGSKQAKVAAKDQGPCEEVDPIDAAIAVTSGKGLDSRYEEVPDPSGAPRKPEQFEVLSPADCKRIEERYNGDRKLDKDGENARCRVLGATRQTNGKVIAHIQESPNEARRRWQNEVSPKSFHGSIFGSVKNHRNVTAYDLAIGGGLASSDPAFYAYLCAVADWRLQSDEKAEKRSSVLRWERFEKLHGVYWSAESAERKELIKANSIYYSSGNLPSCVPALHVGLPKLVICETVAGDRVMANPSGTQSGKKEKQ